MNLQERVWEVIDVAKLGDRLSRGFDMALIILILLNVFAVIIGSVPSIQSKYGAIFRGFEIFSVSIFTVEYLTRIWSCTCDIKYAGSVAGRLKWMTQPLSIIDLLAILPFFFTYFGVDLRVVRAFRLFRIVRIFKLGRYSSAIRLLGRVFVKRKEELTITSVALVFLIIISATLMYYAEFEAQPDHFSSIPATLWWSVVTLTTVGYGDVYPVTLAGKIVAGMISILGIGMVALPAGIISAGFVEELSSDKQRDESDMED